jgi:hypothetical protein
MRPGKGLFKVASWVLGITTLLAFLPGNVSAHPVDLSGVGRFGNKLTHIAQDIGKTLSELQTNIAADVQKITTPTTTTTKLPPEPPTTPIVLPSRKVTVSVAPDKDTEIQSPSGKVTLKIPAGALAKQTDIEFIEYGAQESTGMQILNMFELNAKETATAKVISTFQKNLEITIDHEPEELAAIDKSSLRLFYLDEKTKQWLPADSLKYDPKTKKATANISHFSHYGEFATALSVGPGRIMASEVVPQTGAFTFDYPIELPPGPGGFQPKLALTYNSALVDQMKSKQAVGSWVGIGWDMNFGKITYDQ